jgi:hypothetical protein
LLWTLARWYGRPPLFVHAKARHLSRVALVIAL